MFVLKYLGLEVLYRDLVGLLDVVDKVDLGIHHLQLIELLDTRNREVVFWQAANKRDLLSVLLINLLDELTLLSLKDKLKPWWHLFLAVLHLQGLLELGNVGKWHALFLKTNDDVGA